MKRLFTFLGFRSSPATATAATVTLIEKKSGPWLRPEIDKFVACGGKIWRSGGNKIAAVKLPELYFLYRALGQENAEVFTSKVVPIRGPEMKVLFSFA